MNFNELFEAENGFYVIDGVAITSSSVDPTFEAPDGTIFIKSTGEKFKMINAQWIQVSNKQTEFLLSSIYDDVVPSHATALFSSPDLEGELEIEGEVLIL